MTPEELAAATHAIAIADGWWVAEIKSGRPGRLQMQEYEDYAKAAIEAVDALRQSAGNTPRTGESPR